jgi:Tfp pilus assembly protein PilV
VLRHGRLRSESGFTIVEVLVSALMIVFIAGAAATALITTAHASGDQRFRAQADELATQDQERLRGLSDEQLGQLNGSSSTHSVTVNGSTYSVVSTDAYLDSTGGSSCASSAAAYYKVTSTVSWTEGFSNQSPSVTEESLLSRPVTGDLLTQVQDQTGQGLAGATVSATGPNTSTTTGPVTPATTDANGCTLLAGLSPGAYTVAISDPGYVDVNGGTASLSGTATVSTTSVASTLGNPFHIGQASTIAATFTTASGAAGASDGLSWLGSGGSLQMSQYKTTTSSAPAGSLSTGAMFPFDTSATSTPGYTNNYTVWAGRCLQQEPPASTGGQYTVLPGTNSAQNVAEPLFDLTDSYNGGSVKPTLVKLTFTSSKGTSCTDTWTPAIATGPSVPSTGWLASPGQPFASTASTGATASASSTSTSPEAGSLTVCVDYTDPSTHKNWFGQLTGVSNTNFTATPSPTLVTVNQAGSC